jgi:hypothetical protein
MQNAPQKNITPKFLDEFRYHFIELSVSYLEKIGTLIELD